MYITYYVHLAGAKEVLGNKERYNREMWLNSQETKSGSPEALPSNVSRSQS
jgi:hypothetical protein